MEELEQTGIVGLGMCQTHLNQRSQGAVPSCGCLDALLGILIEELLGAGEGGGRGICM